MGNKKVVESPFILSPEVRYRG